MSDKIQFYDYPIGQSATCGNTTCVGKADQLLVYVSSVTGNFASSPVCISLTGAYQSGVSARTIHYYDYGCKEPESVKVSVSTGGLYEFPWMGGAAFINICFDVETSQAVNLQLLAPRTTF